MTKNAKPKLESQIDYYLENFFPQHHNDAPFAVYIAVVDGRIRCRFSGTLHIRQLSKANWGPGYLSPADLAISVDDALGVKIQAPDDKKSTGKITALLDTLIAETRMSRSRKSNPRAILVGAVAQLVDEIWPNGIPEGLKAKDRNAKIVDEAKRRGISQPSPRTIGRALGQRAK